MIGEFERYHGAALRELVVGAGKVLRLEATDDLGRINTYVVNDHVGVHMKHSSKRLPPWQFTYSDEHVAEVLRLAARCESVFLVHVCGSDGIAALTLSEFLHINPSDSPTTPFVRVDRDRNTMYRVNGTAGRLPKPRKRGLDIIHEKLGERA